MEREFFGPKANFERAFGATGGDEGTGYRGQVTADRE
jgi:hypothetical protein